MGVSYAQCQRLSKCKVSCVQCTTKTLCPNAPPGPYFPSLTNLVRVLPLLVRFRFVAFMWAVVMVSRRRPTGWFMSPRRHLIHLPDMGYDLFFPKPTTSHEPAEGAFDTPRTCAARTCQAEGEYRHVPAARTCPSADNPAPVAYAPDIHTRVAERDVELRGPAAPCEEPAWKGAAVAPPMKPVSRASVVQHRYPRGGLCR